MSQYDDLPQGGKAAVDRALVYLKDALDDAQILLDRFGLPATWKGEQRERDITAWRETLSRDPDSVHEALNEIDSASWAARESEREALKRFLSL